MNSIEQLPLRDIHLPEPVSWWPLAPGWWMLLALLIGVPLALAAVHRSSTGWRRHRRLKRSALSEIEKIEAQYRHQCDRRQLVQSLSVLLRRVCITHYPLAQVASLADANWLNFLDQALEQPEFSHGPGQALIEAPYKPSAEFDADALLALCRRWMNALPAAKRQV